MHKFYKYVTVLVHRPMKTSPSIEVEDLTVAYGKDVVFKDESFKLEGQGLTIIIGPNGSGKTTLFKTILGLIVPLKGKVYVNNIDVTGRPEASGKLIGYVPQVIDASSNFPLSVREMVESAILLRMKSLRSKPPHEVEELVWKTLERMSLNHIANKPLKSLSGGQRQRVLLARALVWDPPIIIMDEPTSSIDPQGRAEFIDYLGKLNDSKQVLVSSHDPSPFLKYVKNVIIVNKRIVALGPPREVLKLEVLKNVYGDGIALIDERLHLVDSHVP